MCDETFCKEYRIKEADLVYRILLAGIGITELEEMAKQEILYPIPRYTKGFRSDKGTMVVVEITAGQKKRNIHGNRNFMRVDYLHMRVLQMICALDRSY